MTAVNQLTGQLAGQRSPLRAYHLPPRLMGTMPPRSVLTVQEGASVLEVLDEEPAYYRALAGHLRASHTLIAPQLTDNYIIELLVHAARRWREPAHPFRRLAVSVLPALTGYAPAMIEEGLDHRLAQLTPERLGRLVDDAGDRLAAQGKRLEGPPVVLLVVAGHIPGLVIDDLAALLLVKSAGVIRPSARDPVIPPLFVRTLAELDPRVGELLAVMWWPRETDAISTALGGAVDSVVASGHDATIAALTQQTCRIIGYGHRRSVALIGADALTDADALAACMARDVSWYEQRGCLSPHVVYVEEGGSITPRNFAEHVAEALGNEAVHWAPSAIPLEAGAAILHLRTELEFRESTGAQMLPIRKKRTAMGGSGGEEHLLPELSERFVRADLSGGAVLYDPDPAPRPSPGYRTLWVKPAPRLEDALEALSPWRGRIESFGISLSDERLADLSPLIDRLGPSRVTPIGTMQEPPLQWRLLEQGLLLRLSE
jgi:Acyl-CoA reductase (LuxC)